MTRIKKAIPSLTITVVAHPDAPAEKTAGLVPMIRVGGPRSGQLMAWVERTEELRGCTEILMKDDTVEVIFAEGWRFGNA
jgi:hypothetical protein